MCCECRCLGCLCYWTVSDKQQHSKDVLYELKSHGRRQEKDFRRHLAPSRPFSDLLRHTNRDNRDLKSCTLPFTQKDDRAGRSTEMSKHLFVTYILFDTTLNATYILFNTKSSIEKNVDDEEI